MKRRGASCCAAARRRPGGGPRGLRGRERFNPSEAEAEQPITAKVDGDLYYFNYRSTWTPA